MLGKHQSILGLHALSNNELDVKMADFEFMEIDDATAADAVAELRAGSVYSPVTSHQYEWPMDIEPQTGFLQAVIVVDTNYLVGRLFFLNNLLELLQTHPTVSMYVPWVVVQELDKLKMRNRVKGAAAKANTWLHKNYVILRTRGIRLQSKADPQVNIFDASEVRKAESRRDSGSPIKWQVPTHAAYRNLCVKANAHDVKTISYDPGVPAEFLAQVMKSVAGAVPDMTLLTADQKIAAAVIFEAARIAQETLFPVYCAIFAKYCGIEWSEILRLRITSSSDLPIERMLRLTKQHWDLLFAHSLPGRFRDDLDMLHSIVEDARKGAPLSLSNAETFLNGVDMLFDACADVDMPMIATEVRTTFHEFKAALRSP
ncbi:hypothetical protein HK102_012764 [Quaeritorhiza haematococci]|nr:hypothetical protein HK102_012764 [Quaeritorhiza haematococci]